MQKEKMCRKKHGGDSKHFINGYFIFLNTIIYKAEKAR